tara:strand:- start:185 stop:517 length:333 start_codon:yes stop_codon:yes gene_type:complete
MVEVVRSNITINQFRAKEESDFGKVVKFVEWTYAWTHNDYPGASVDSVFVTALPEASADGFVAFDDITKDNLIDWALSVEGATLDKIESHAMAQLPYEYALSQTSIYHIG